MQVIIGDPAKKLNKINFILLKSIFSKMLAIGIINKNGN